MQCTGSLVIPGDDIKSKNAQDGADWGHMVHKWKETGEIVGRDKRSATALKKAIEVSGIDRLELWPPEGKHETSLALWVGGEPEVYMGTPYVVGPGAEDYAGRDGWVTGHEDFHWLLFDGTLWVDDLKTGKSYPNPLPGLPGWRDDLEFGENRYPQDPWSPQQRTYALILALHLRHTGPTAVSITHWPRLPLSERHAPPVRTWANYKHEDLLAHWKALRVTEAERRHNARAMLGHEDSMILKPGDHCRFCPARNNCFVAKEFE
jgi:hypothetical protein